ncbi:MULTISPECIES: Ig-like domain-containing protein [unclassified Nocardioides]|uniref:Ig-like domain-containing protein n=1 Tax=unclassified Nocardioides TaxID=2615069 RepID=UPI0030145073
MKLSRTLRGTSLAVAAVLAASTASALCSPASAASVRSLVAASADGLVFDLDEYDAGDVTVQLRDSVAGPVDADDTQDLRYRWKVTPFDKTVPAITLPATGFDTVTDDVTGAFTVPLPAGQPSGTYVLTAGLGATGTGTGAIAEKVLLTVKAGQAALTLGAGESLRAPAGDDVTVTGALALEDGTGLVGRLVDLELTRGAAGTDPRADAGFVPVVAGAPLETTRQLTTAAAGAISVVVSDPEEAGQGTELGGVLAATTVEDVDLDDPAADTTLALDLVSLVPPVDSTVTMGDPGDGKPGEVLGSTVTVLAPDDSFDVDPDVEGVQGDADADPDPVEGQVLALGVDHGFFTDGEVTLPTEVGAPAGTWTDLGKKVELVTAADGTSSYDVAIARDKAFDKDGKLTATVSAAADKTSATATADWDTAAPLNGRVALVLSPKGEQDGPVAPAQAGTRTYYEVYAQDQFGNPVGGEPIDLSYAGNLDDWDYSDDFMVSDFDQAGDIWVVSFENADIELTGTWNDAPTLTYTDTLGGTGADTAAAVGTATARFYELDFGRSRFALQSSATGMVPIGTAVRQTVRVTDQRGNPVPGYQVQFFRLGPDGGTSEPRAVVSTNARGEAAYTFVGSAAGRAQVTATVSDGFRSRTLTGGASFGHRVSATLRGSKAASRKDQVTVTAPRTAAKARVVLYRVQGSKRIAVARGVLSGKGTVDLAVRDRNGKRKKTTYVAVVAATGTTFAAQTNTVRVK